MSFAITCLGCKTRLRFASEHPGGKARCPNCKAPILVPPPGKAVAPPPQAPPALPARARPIPPLPAVAQHELPGPAHSLRPFPAGLVLVLSVLTCSTFATTWLLLLHGKLPRRRPDDPSAGQALGLAFVPFFSLYWVPFALHRLLVRLNEQRREWGLPEMRLNGLLALFVLGVLASFLTPLGALHRDLVTVGLVLGLGGPLVNWFVAVPLFATLVQTGVNALAEAPRARRARHPEARLLQIELRWRATQWFVWGAYLSAVLCLHASLVFVVAALQREPDVVPVALLHLALFDLPLLLAALSLFARGLLMRARVAALEDEPPDVAAAVRAERRTTAGYQLAWGMVLLAVGALSFAVLAWNVRRWESYAILDTLLLPMLVPVGPFWVAGLCLLAKVARPGLGALPETAAPLGGLQGAPMPWWPTLVSGTGGVLLLVAIGACHWHARRSWDRPFARSDVKAAATSSSDASESVDGEEAPDFAAGDDRLNGEWAPTAVEPPEEGGRAKDEVTWRFRGDRLTVTRRSSASISYESYRLVLDREARPMRLEALSKRSRLDGGGEETAFRGIYELRGDALRLCTHRSKAPHEFVAERGDGNTLSTLRRR